MAAAGNVARRAGRGKVVVAARGSENLNSLSGLSPYGSFDADTADVISVARRRMSERPEAAQPNPVTDFLRKLRLAWQVRRVLEHWAIWRAWAG